MNMGQKKIEDTEKLGTILCSRVSKISYSKNTYFQNYTLFKI